MGTLYCAPAVDALHAELIGVVTSILMMRALRRYAMTDTEHQGQQAETLPVEEDPEETLVEEVSIDGMCGVY